MNYFSLLLSIILILTSSIFSSVSAQENQKKVALILSGGGGRGAAHVGVLKVLEKENIAIDTIIGTSVGALIGALYASGVSIEDIENFIGQGKFNRFYKTSFPPFKLLFYAPMKGLAKLGNKNYFPGIYSGEDFKKFVNMEIPKKGYKKRDIIFKAVTADLLTGRIVELNLNNNDNVGEIIQASIAVPGLRKPILINDQLIIDGGTLNLNPVRTKEELNVDLVIVIDATPQIETKELKEFNSFENIITRTINLALHNQKKSDVSKADLVIVPDLNGMEMLDLNKKHMKEAIVAGEKATLNMIPEIKELIRN